MATSATNRRKRPPLLSSLSVQLPTPEHDEPERYHEERHIRRRFARKESLQSSLTTPREDEEFILPHISKEEKGNLQEKENWNESIEQQVQIGFLNIDEENISEKKLSLTLEHKSLLVRAIINNNLDEINERLSAGDDVNAEDESTFRPLHYACKIGNLEAIKLLLKAGCDKYGSNNDRVTSLHVAVRSGNEAAVTALLEAGVIPDVREKKRGRTPVHEATLLANCKVLKVLVTKLQEDPWEAQKILRISDKDGQTALHIASSKIMPEAISLLLAAGADVAATDNEGLTPMHATLLSHRGKRRCGGVLTQLLEAGGDVEVEGGEDNEKLSHFAARAGCSICLNFLSERGAALTVKNRQGRTPLHVAASEGKYDAAKFLMSRVDLEASDNQGYRPLHLAILSDSPCMVETFLQQGADPLGKDNDGRTYVQLAVLRRKTNAFQALVRSKAVQLPDELGENIIHYCSALGFHLSVNFLLENGWDINLKDSKGRTPLHRALNHGQEELAILLINAGASLHATDMNGATPLHYAVRWGGSDAILRLLVKKKAQLGVKDRLGRIPLHYAASKFSIMSDLYILLGGGSVLDSQDEMGLTPLHLAARLGNESLVRILLDNGAKHDIRDIDDFLPIDHAIEKNHKSIVRRLKLHDKKMKNASNTSDEPEEVLKESLMKHRKSLAW